MAVPWHRPPGQVCVAPRLAKANRASHQIRMPGQDWQGFGDVVSQPGQSVWLGRGQLTREQGYPTNLLAHWEVGGEEPWLLATGLADRARALVTYRRRMWVEGMFGDLRQGL